MSASPSSPSTDPISEIPPQGAAPVVPPRRMPRGLFYGLLAGLYVLDQATKYWAEYTLSTFEPQPSIQLIPGFFSLHYVQNRGVAFGFMADQTLAMVVISVLLLAAGIYYATVLDWNRLETNVAGAMLLSGALGNITDRVIYGYVIDFFHVYIGTTFDYPVFNVADSAICLSVGYIFLRQLGLWEKSEASAPPPPSCEPAANGFTKTL
ncbi:signal peptidase II [Verrucomicrobia bacterium LW23]|nr:signal peptidase II [Verrucomicrobia bacterium LW23]